MCKRGRWVITYFIIHSPEDCITTTLLEGINISLAVCLNYLLQYRGLVGTLEAMDAMGDEGNMQFPRGKINAHAILRRVVLNLARIMHDFHGNCNGLHCTQRLRVEYGWFKKHA